MENDPTFDVQTPTGHVLTIQAPDQETALAGARQWHDDNSGLWGNIKGAVTSFPQGVVKGFQTLEKVGLALGGATEQDTSPEFDPFGAMLHRGEQKALDVLPPVAPNTGGRIGDVAGQMVGFNPIGLATGPVGAITSSFASAGGGEAGRQLAEGTPYEGAAELAGGVLGPYALTKATELGAKGVGRMIGGLGTHAGAEVPQEAFNAGLAGGDAGQTFRANMRDQVSPDKMIEDAQGALGNLYRARGENYQAASDKFLKNNPQIVSYDGIDKALADSQRIGTFEGVSTNPSTDKTRTLIQKTVDYWKGLGQENPKFTTAEGMVGLKQRVMDIRDNLEKFSPQWKVADESYQSIKKSIEDQVPQYAAMSKNYALDTKEANNIKKVFSLGSENSDTITRKLQSIARDNANTNYGARSRLAQVLAENGAPNLTEAVAGQASKSWLPRGLGKVVSEGGIMGVLGGALSPAALMLAPVTSPRLTGEAAHFAGRAAGYFNMPQAFESMQGKEQMAKNLATLLALKSNQ